MVDDRLFDSTEVPFDEYAVTPKEKHTKTDSAVRAEARDAFQAQLADDPGVIVLTHGDADGLTSAALVVEGVASDTVAVSTVDYSGPYSLVDAFTDIYEARHDLSAFELYVLDYNWDGNDEVFEALAPVVDRCDLEGVQWFDHHQWDDAPEIRLSDAGVDLVVDEDECTATLLANYFDDIPEQLREVAEVTKDYDLWIREDPRSGRLQTYAYIAEPWEYIDTVRTYGMDFPAEVDNAIDEQIAENERLHDEAVRRADYKEVAGSTVAITYIRGGESAEIGNTLVEEEGADIAVVQKPHTGMGIYADSSHDGFTKCHLVAEQLGGGGHKTAAGCDFEPRCFRELADYWASAGESHRTRVIDAIHTVATA